MYANCVRFAAFASNRIDQRSIRAGRAIGIGTEVTNLVIIEPDERQCEALEVAAE
jgi:hypothetical protein